MTAIQLLKQIALVYGVVLLLFSLHHIILYYPNAVSYKLLQNLSLAPFYVVALTRFVVQVVVPNMIKQALSFIEVLVVDCILPIFDALWQHWGYPVVIWAHATILSILQLTIDVLSFVWYSVIVQLWNVLTQCINNFLIFVWQFAIVPIIHGFGVMIEFLKFVWYSMVVRLCNYTIQLLIDIVNFVWTRIFLPLVQTLLDVGFFLWENIVIRLANVVHYAVLSIVFWLHYCTSIVFHFGNLLLSFVWYRVVVPFVLKPFTYLSQIVVTTIIWCIAEIGSGVATVYHALQEITYNTALLISSVFFTCYLQILNFIHVQQKFISQLLDNRYEKVLEMFY